jgi:hypothetical protein|tara:strand:- start:63 stop:500 length:438 start_codon:yes stop_codon:yes gene_type:complete
MLILSGIVMGESDAPEWKIMAIIGIIFLLDATFFNFSFLGPWNSNSFTLGVIGLIGLSLIYVSWYRFTFKRKGLIPWLDNWQNPLNSAKNELVVGLISLLSAWFVGNKLQFNLPNPTGLILALIGSLMILHSIYVLLSIGPLKDN